MRRLIVARAVTAGLLAVAVGLTVAPPRGDGSASAAPETVTEVRVRIEHSRFDVPDVVVREGSTVRFLVVNDDPIAHEFVIGDAETHRRHERGDEREHPPVPGEVTLRPGERRPTVFTFDEAGTVRFACHLPGHVAYGMEGELEVRA